MGKWERLVTEHYPNQPVWRLYWNTKHGLNSPTVLKDWWDAQDNASKAANWLASVLAEGVDEFVVLCGHSLGGRLMLETALNLAQMGLAPRIETIHLLGAAARRKDLWKEASPGVSGTIWNYHSRHDKNLEWLFKTSKINHLFGSGHRNAIGRKGFHFDDTPNMENIDVTNYVGSDHSGYMEKIPNLEYVR